MKKIFAVFAVLLLLSLAVLPVFAETVSETTSSDVASTESATENRSSEESEIRPGVDKAISNLKYMGLGMLGIFAVVGVVILITILLNSVTGKK